MLKRNMQAVIVIVIIAAAAVLLTPIALAGNVSVPVAQITFSETTSGSVHIGGACYSSTTVQCNSTSTTTVYQYYYLGRPSLVSTTNTKINSTAGSTNITLSLWLTTPNSFSSLGTVTFSGGVGNRTHTLYLSIDQGVRTSGMYKLTVTVDASSLYYGATKAATSAAGFETTFKI